MRIHLLAPPTVQTTADYYLDGFNMITRRFARLLDRLGHEVILYASEENDVPCRELVTCITKAEQLAMLDGHPYQDAPYRADAPWFLHFNGNASHGIGARKQPGDIIASIAGNANAAIFNTHPEIMALEWSIGYPGAHAPYRVYQSHVWRHYVHGQERMISGRTFDAVIPPFFDAEQFEVNPTEDYLLYVGRLTPRKGVAIACDTARAAGLPLKIIGHGDVRSCVNYGEYLGSPDDTTRNEIMSKARALLAPTQYLEPFGCVVAEAQLCGTPVISTDFGAFVESVEHGKTGFRCSTLGEFVAATGAVDSLDRSYVRSRAQSLYSMESAERSYADYFDRLQTLQGGPGFTSAAPGAIAPYLAGAAA